MGYEAKKTEHSRSKRGNGAYWGYKSEAKKESNRIPRENWKVEIRNALADQGNVNHRARAGLPLRRAVLSSKISSGPFTPLG